MKLPNGNGSVYKIGKKRRRPYIVVITFGWEINQIIGKLEQKRVILGYTKSKVEGMKMLAEYRESPYDLEVCKKTFKEVYENWSNEKFETISKSNVNGYRASFNACTGIHDNIFKDLRTSDLQHVIDNCGKNYPTLRKLKVLFNQLYDYAMKHDICSKDYSEYIDILKHKAKNPNKRERDRLSEEDVQKLWNAADNLCVQIILMLIYTGVRVSELLDLKREDVHLDKQYFDVIRSKTENGIRRVPIADKVLPFFRTWYESSKCKYLVRTNENEHFKYRNYYDAYWKSVIKSLI